MRAALLGLVLLACTSATQAGANTVNIEQAVCLADETAASLIPPGTWQQAAEDIALVCQDVPIQAIVQFIEGLAAKNAADGVAPATAYRPSPHVMAAHAGKTRAFGDGAK